MDMGFKLLLLLTLYDLYFHPLKNESIKSDSSYIFFAHTDDDDDDDVTISAPTSIPNLSESSLSVSLIW